MAPTTCGHDSILESVEKRVAECIGTRHAIVCSSARNAIRFSLLALGIGHKDEVVIPDFSCQILPIVVFCTGARPRFCEVDRKTCTMTLTSLIKVLNVSTKAVILIHPLGLPADALTIREITEKMGIALIEDAAQSLGASIHHRQTGSVGNVGVLSFNKFLNCNLGGAAVTNDENLAHEIAVIRAEKERKALFPSLGYRLMEAFKLKSRKNMKIFLGADNVITKHLKWRFARKHIRNVDSWTTIDSFALRSWCANALTSIMIDQLMACGGTYWHRRKMENSELLLLDSEFKNLESYLQGRRRIAKIYGELLEENGFDKIPILHDSEPSYLRYPVMVHEKGRLNRLMKTLKSMGFNPEDYRYRPLHRSPVFGYLNGKTNFPDSTYVSEHILPLPITPEMSHEIIARISFAVNVDKAGQEKEIR